VRVVWLGAVGKGQAMRKTNFLPGVLGLLAAVPWCPAAAPEPPPAAQNTYIYANSHLWRAQLVRKDVAPPNSMSQRTVTLSMSKVPVVEVLRYVCMGTGLRYRFEKEGIIIEEKRCALLDPRFQIFTVTPAFAQAVGSEPSAAKLRQYWEALGIDFPPAFEVRYVHARRLLFLRNISPNLDKIEQELRSRGMFESKAYTYGPPILDEIPYRHKLDLIIPFVEVEEVPVSKFLGELANKVRAIDPEHQGVNFLLYDNYLWDGSAMFSEDDCQQHFGFSPVLAEPNMAPSK